MTYYQISRSELLSIFASSALMFMAMIAGTMWCAFYISSNQFINMMLASISGVSAIVGGLLFLYVCQIVRIIISEHEPS